MLPRRAPHALQVPILLRQPVQRIVALAPGPNEPGQGVGRAVIGVAAVLVNLSDGDLHGGMVFGLDDAVGRRALASGGGVSVWFLGVCFAVGLQNWGLDWG